MDEQPFSHDLSFGQRSVILLDCQWTGKQNKCLLKDTQLKPEVCLEVLFKERKVASHRRRNRKAGYPTRCEQMPKTHEPYLADNPFRRLRWTAKMGPCPEKRGKNLSFSHTSTKTRTNDFLGSKNQNNERNQTDA